MSDRATMNPPMTDVVDLDSPDDIALADRMNAGRAADRHRAAEDHHRPGRGHQPGADDAVRRRQQPDRRRARPGQDAADPHDGARARPEVLAHPVHARPDAVRHHRHRPGAGGRGDRPPADGVRARADLRQHRAGRRNQPHAAEDAVGAARGDAGAPRHHAGQDLPARTSRSTCSPRRTRSSSKAPIRCPKRSSIASCSTSSSSTRPTTRSSTSSGRRRRFMDPKLERPITGEDLIAFQRLVRKVPVAEPVMRHALDIVRASRPKDTDAPGLRQEVGGVRRQRARGAVPGARRQGARADQRPLSRQLRGHPRAGAPGAAPPHHHQLPRAVGRRSRPTSIVDRLLEVGAAAALGDVMSRSSRTDRRAPIPGARFMDPGGARTHREPGARVARGRATASSTACTRRRTSARRWTSPSIAATCPATTSAAWTGGCGRGPTATTSRSTKPRRT